MGHTAVKTYTEDEVRLLLRKMWLRAFDDTQEGFNGEYPERGERDEGELLAFADRAIAVLMPPDSTLPRADAEPTPTVARHLKIAAPDDFPLFGWTPEAVKAHLGTHPPEVGDPMIIYSSHGGFHHYQLAQVVNAASGPQKRVVLSKAGYSGGTAFHRSGINAFMPKGQTRMLPPIPALMAHLSLTCDVSLDLPPYANADWVARFGKGAQR